MSDEEQASLEEDRPAEDAPDGAEGEQSHNWERDYKELQGTYTQASQELAELRKWKQSLLEDPDTRKQFVEQFYELEEDEEPPEDRYADPVDAIQRELEELKQWRSQREQSEQAEAFAAARAEHFEEQLDAIEKEAGEEFTEDEVKALWPLAIQFAGEDRMPNVKEAFKALSGLYDAKRESWTDSKRKARRAPAGSSASKVPDLDTPQAQEDYINSRLAEMTE